MLKQYSHFGFPMQKNNENILIKELAKEFKFDICMVKDSKLPNIAAIRLK